MRLSSNTLARLLGRPLPTDAPQSNRQQSSQSLDLALLFDTTGSMFPYLTQVRNKLSALADEIYRAVPKTRIAVVAFGDYCDVGTTYVTKTVGLTGDIRAVASFINGVEPTGGGDEPEAVEEALFEANQLQWNIGSRRAVVLVGDAPPHGVIDSPSACQNGHSFKNEASQLGQKGVSVFTVQCADSEATTRAFRQIADLTGGKHLSLNTIDDLIELLVAICMRQVGLLDVYKEDLRKQGRLSVSKQKLLSELSDD